MPGLDRRITVRRTMVDKDEFGRDRGHTYVDRTVWATRIDKDSQRVVDEGGAIGTRKRVYRVRYRQDIITAALDATARVIDDGLELTIENVITAADTGPLAERRRFLELEVEGATN